MTPGLRLPRKNPQAKTDADALPSEVDGPQGPPGARKSVETSFAALNDQSVEQRSGRLGGQAICTFKARVGRNWPYRKWPITQRNLSRLMAGHSRDGPSKSRPRDDPSTRKITCTDFTQETLRDRGHGRLKTQVGGHT